MNRYLVDPIVKRLQALWVPAARVDEWLKNWRFFFILAYGRSGTAFMANLLGHGQGTHVFHEPVLEDFYAHARAHYSPQAAERYIRGFRQREIYLRMRHVAPGVYGEVNSTLRCHAAAIRHAFPGVTLIHLVRDGRDVVRSTFGRRTMTLRNPFSMSLHPVKSDPWFAHWPKMDRLARICWLWQEENRRLRTTASRTVQFERILASYEYFAEQVLEPCKIHVGKETWERAIAQPQNITHTFQMPKWETWTMQQQVTFREICGAEMANCGYVF